MLPVEARGVNRRDLDLSDPFDWERSLCQRLDREPQQEQRVVVAGRAIQAELLAPSASMDQHPLAVTSDADRDGLHERTTIGVSVAGAAVVEMAAPQTTGAVIPVCLAEGLDGDIQPAVAASERIRPPRRARWRWSRDIREPPGRGRWKTRRRALRGFRKGQNRENRPFSGRDTTTTEQTVIGHLLLVGPPEWRKHFKVASRGGRHNPWWLGGLPNVRLPAHNPLPAEVRSCGPDGPGARLFVPLSDEMASGPRGPARAAARRGHAPSPILSVLPWGLPGAWLSGRALASHARGRRFKSCRAHPFIAGASAGALAKLTIILVHAEGHASRGAPSRGEGRFAGGELAPRRRHLRARRRRAGRPVVAGRPGRHRAAGIRH